MTLRSMANIFLGPTRPECAEEGYVYLLECLTTGRIKVGFSTNPGARSEALRLLACRRAV